MQNTDGKPRPRNKQSVLSRLKGMQAELRMRLRLAELANPDQRPILLTGIEQDHAALTRALDRLRTQPG